MAKKVQRKSRLGIESLEQRALLAADVYISEIVASNDLSLADEDGDSPDWIEIYNAGPDDVDLDGWHLTDDPANLQKWSFPNQQLSAGNFLLVYASDKDRAVADSPLHTNFKLSSGGEYLALTANGVGGAIDVISEFAPEFPFQFTDISYGVGQSVSETNVSLATDGAKLFVPQNDALDTLWTTNTFNDNSWMSATAAIGYQQTIPGFTVQDVKSSSSLTNLTETDSLLNGNGVVSETIAIASVVNFRDPGGGGGTGNFINDSLFPNDGAGDDNDFAIRATGTIVVPTSGTWSFGINSDDGARLRIDGQNVINDDTLHAPRDTYGSRFLTAGEHSIELVFFERGGGAEVELFAAQGSFSSFNTAFRLVGDVANGGLEVKTSPTGTGGGFASLYQTDVGSAMFNQSTDAYLRIPFTVSDPSSLDSLTLRMNYDDGFVAYVNGTEVARRNAPAGNVTANAAAASDRLRSEAEFVESISLTQFLGELVAGANTLAIHGLNDASGSDEFMIRAELSELSVTSGDRFYFPTPTPRDFNPSTGVEGFLTDEITYSQPHGFYTSPFALSLNAETAGTTIRYTLDGSEPTATNGTIYASPVTIDSTTTIRARAFKDGLDPSFVETQTFLFLDDVVDQSRNSTIAAGFPSSDVNGQSLDYGMDPDIVDNSAWEPQMLAALTQIPSMSVVMEIDDLLGSSDGIYTNAQSHGRAWERPASLELLNPDGTEGFNVEAGIRVRGGFSRSDGNPKHAFRLFFRDEYGDAKLEYPLFGDEGTDEYDKIDLRTAQNYSWSFRGNGNNTFIRDVFSRDVQGAMENPYTRSRFYHLYINGQYWGLYQTQERAEANYAADYFGGKSSDYDVVKSAGSSGGYQNEATDGNLEAYHRLAEMFYQPNGLSDANQVEYMKAQGLNPDGSVNPDYERLLDVDNLIDYMLITYYTSDADGPGSRFTRPRVNNYFGIFNREDPDGFKFFEHDSEHSLDTGNAAGANYNMVEPFSDGGAQLQYFNPHWMHDQLAMNNVEYRTKFMDRVTEQLFNDGILTAENANAIVDARAEQIDLAIIAESARWGDAKRTDPFTKNDWLSAVDRIREFIGDRVPDVVDQLRNVDWYPSENPPQFLVNGSPQHGGDIGSVDNVTIATSTTFQFNQTFVDDGASWKYLDNGSDQGTAWRETGFNDASWASGVAELGYGDGNEATELSFGPDSNDKFVTTYFRKSFNVADASNVDGLKLRLQRDDGAVVYLNGVEVARSNMPSGAIDSETSALGVAGGGDETTFYEFDVAPELLVNGNNVLAVEVHQNASGGGNVTSTDISFDLELLGGSVTANNSTAIYYMADGSDPRLLGGTVNPAANLLDPAAGFTLANTSTVIARTLNGTDWGAALKATFSVESVANDQPIAVSDNSVVVEDTPQTVDLASNDTLSGDGGNVFMIETQPTNGTAVVTTSGVLTYTPNANFNGSDSLTYRLQDVDGDSSVASATLVVVAVDDFPIAVNDSFSVSESELLSGSVATNDSLSGDGGNVFALLSSGANGEAVMEADGSFTYAPNPGFSGADTFLYFLTDADGDTVTASVNVEVTSVNSVPVAVADAFDAVEDTILNGNIATNDTLSADGGNVFALVTNASNGTVTMNANGSFAYVPGANYNGSDSFVYSLTDVDGDVRTATVTLSVASVDDVPVAVDDTADATEDIQLSRNLAANDTLSGDGGNVFALLSNASNGNVAVDPNGSFTYSPNANYNGSDSFTYSLTDADGDVRTATVTLNIASVDDFPVAANDAVNATEDLVLSGSVSGNDTLSGDGGNVFSLAMNASNGNVTVDPNGSFIYTPNANYNGSDSFTYSLTDADGDVRSATVSITVLPAADVPTAVADTVDGTEDVSASGNVGANDILSGDGGNTFSLLANALNGVVELDSDGGFTYTPNANFNGSDSFRYSLRDADNDESSATVSVNVASVDDLPVVVADSISSLEDQAFSGDVSNNDSPSGDGGNVYSLATDPTSGSVNMNENGMFVYTPNPNFHGIDSFSYSLTDTDGDRVTASVSVNVAPVNDFPVAVGDAISTAQDTAVSGNVSGNDTASGDGGNVYRVSVPPANGVAEMSDNGAYTYTPASGFSGTDSFVYELRDANGDGRTASVTVTVEPAPTIPGDINGDSELSAADIDALAAGLRTNSNDSRFDVNDDGAVTNSDYDYMIETIFQTRVGDADLDGDVDFTDFLALSASFTQQGTGWSQANFNGDVETGFEDFLLMGANFGWEREDVRRRGAR